MSSLYNDELKDVDPIELGIQFHKEGKDPYSYQDDPTKDYNGGKDDDPRWEFLNDFRDKVIRGWHKEDNRLNKIKFDKRLAIFQKNMPIIGDQVWVEFDSNKGSFWHYDIVHVALNRRAVVGSCLDVGRLGQLRILGFPDGFVTFYDKKPDIEENG